MNKQVNPYKAYIVLALVYVLVSVATPISKASQAAYHLTGTQYHVLTFTFILPILGIWFAAFYGYDKLRRYTQLLKKAPEGQGFTDVTKGVMWLAWGLPLASILSTIFSDISRQSPHFYHALMIVHNYVNLIVTIGAFTYISKGTRKLTDSANTHPSRKGVQGLMFSFITLGVLYCYFTIRNIDPQLHAHNGYYMPLWLILLTIMVPYLYAWFMGLLSAYEINLYSNNTKGVLYKQALKLLAGGISAAIISSIVIQYLTSMSPRLSQYTLGYILVIIYLLLLIYSAGYILIAIGANKLKKIEEV